MTKLIDTHAHLYAEEFNDDRLEMIQRAVETGVERMYLPNIDLQSVPAMMDLCDQFPANCFPMMGLHPCSVSADYKNQLTAIGNELSKGIYVGVGETGIDLYWDNTFFEQQKESFRQHVKWAAELDLPLIIHTRNSFNEAFEIVAAAKKIPKGIFHCFSGTRGDAEKIISLKTFKLGIGGVLTYKNSTLPEVVRNIDISYLVLETDSPYLPPVPYRGKRNESAYIKLIAQKLAEVKGSTLEQIATETTENALWVFEKGKE